MKTTQEQALRYMVIAMADNASPSGYFRRSIVNKYFALLAPYVDHVSINEEKTPLPAYHADTASLMEEISLTRYPFYL